MAEDQAAGICDLVVEEFAEILLIHLSLLRIDNGREAVQLDALHMEILHGADDIAELADAGGLDQDAVGGIFLQHLLERLAEVADERAADAAGVHLVDLDAGILEESAVNADLTEFIFDQNELFALVAVLNELLDERCLAGSEEAGEDRDFGHDIHFFHKFSVFTVSVFGVPVRPQAFTGALLYYTTKSLQSPAFYELFHFALPRRSNQI